MLGLGGLVDVGSAVLVAGGWVGVEAGLVVLGGGGWVGNLSFFGGGRVGFTLVSNRVAEKDTCVVGQWEFCRCSAFNGISLYGLYATEKSNLKCFGMDSF